MTLPAATLGLLIVAFLFCRLQAVPIVREASQEVTVPVLCASGCQSDYECNMTSGLCEPIQAIGCEECNNAPTEPVCGFDSKTYINECELRRSNCLNNRSTEIKHNGVCRRCNKLREEMREVNEVYNVTRRSKLYWLCKNSEASINDVMSYYYTPRCSDENDNIFAPRQYNELCKLYWCVTADGDPVTGILTRRSSHLDCSGKQQCEVDGVLYNDGETILRDNCGFSKCINGDAIVISDYCADENGMLSEEELVSLKYDLLYLFHYQYQVQDKVAKVDLVFIRNNIPAMSISLISTFLRWKFKHYDMNGNQVIHELELINLFKETKDLVLTDSFVRTLYDALDSDDSSSVSWDEWYTFFFSLDQGSSSGSGISVMQGK